MPKPERGSAAAMNTNPRVSAEEGGVDGIISSTLGVDMNVSEGANSASPTSPSARITHSGGSSTTSATSATSTTGASGTTGTTSAAGKLAKGPSVDSPGRFKPVKRDIECHMQALTPQQLAQLLHPTVPQSDTSNVLVIDIRPYTMYAFTHVENAVSICIPSTLLKRQSFGFNRIIDFVAPQDVDRLRRAVEMSHVVFYDQFTSHCAPDSSLRRTAAKFLGANPAIADRLYWLAGGLSAVFHDEPHLIEAGDDLMAASQQQENGDEQQGLAGFTAPHNNTNKSNNSSNSNTLLPHMQQPQLPLRSNHFNLNLGPLDDCPRPLTAKAPRSPFSLVPVVTTDTHSMSGSPLSAGYHDIPLDQSSWIMADGDVAARLPELPKWLSRAVRKTEDGYNVLAEQFRKLQSVEKRRISTVSISDPPKFSTSQGPSPNPLSVGPTTPGPTTLPYPSISTLSGSSSGPSGTGSTTPDVTIGPGTIRTPTTPYNKSLFSASSSSGSSPLDVKQEYSHEQRQQVFLQQQRVAREREKQHSLTASEERERELQEQQKLYEQFAIVAGDNPKKNRYTNIAPYSHNRVRVRDSEYLNASYIESPLSQFRYIATQAPVPAAFGDFWWCVWEQHVPLVVMLTALRTESGQIKSNKYWFNSTYDGLSIELMDEHQQKEALIIRQIKLTLNSESRLVSHIQYLNWLDLGCPRDPNEVLELIKLKRELMGDASKDTRVVVHCSAGCGRTGTFCTIDTVTDYLSHLDFNQAQDDEVDRVMEVVSKFREQRVAMVQNQLQLLLCYQTVMLWYSQQLAQVDKQQSVS